MTGYVKIDSTRTTRSFFGSNNNEDSGTPDIDWRARGGRHKSDVPCEGTALNGGIYVDGTVGWKKSLCNAVLLLLSVIHTVLFR